MVNFNVTDHDIELARKEGQKAANAVHAIAARYLPNRERIEIDLSTGWSVLVPKTFSHRTADANAIQCANIQITDSGLGLHWPLIDEDWYVPAVIESLSTSQFQAA
jgi:hypothetical protein